MTASHPHGTGLHITHDALRRGRRTVLAAGTLHAPPGSVVALVGANGAGKSTLLLAAAGILRANLGTATITLAGRPESTVAFVPQHPALPPWVTIRAAAALHGAAPHTLALHAARLGLRAELDRPANTLSDGQRQCLAVAIALACPHPVVLLDEPFSAVDLTRRPLLRTLVAEWSTSRRDGVAVLSSHVAADLAELCDWVVAIHGGGYTYQGPTTNLAPRDDVRGFEARVAELLR